MESNPNVAGKEKWIKRGFESKAEYIGWLQFNDLVEGAIGFDDVYYDQYSGKVTRITEEISSEKDEADIFLEQAGN